MNAWRPSGVSSPNIHSANLSAALFEKSDELSKSETTDFVIATALGAQGLRSLEKFLAKENGSLMKRKN